MVRFVNTLTFVAPNLAWGKARRASIPRQWGCDRGATQPQAKFGATLRACPKIPRGLVFAPKAGWRGATKENILPGSSTEEQRSQAAFGAKTLRAAGLLSVACV
ncbi:MAG: hypothetical protein FJ398_23055, partial [Verrucomicrobia bacterium]|nr:hypothetical protein [Verrucomicrobiota bacterium]